MREVGGLVADLGCDDLPPHGRLPHRRPFNLPAQKFSAGGAIVGHGQRARFKFLIADQQQHVQLCHAAQRTGGELRVPRCADDHRHVLQRHGFVRATLHVRNMKLVKLDADFQVRA